MGAKIKPWIALKKKRGGQPGNQNRRTHGFYGAESRIRGAVIAALVRECDAVIARVEARVTLRKKIARAAQRRAAGQGRRRGPLQKLSWPASRGPSRDARAFFQEKRLPPWMAGPPDRATRDRRMAGP